MFSLSLNLAIEFHERQVRIHVLGRVLGSVPEHLWGGCGLGGVGAGRIVETERSLNWRKGFLLWVLMKVQFKPAFFPGSIYNPHFSFSFLCSCSGSWLESSPGKESRAYWLSLACWRHCQAEKGNRVICFFLLPLFVAIFTQDGHTGQSASWWPTPCPPACWWSIRWWWRRNITAVLILFIATSAASSPGGAQSPTLFSLCFMKAKKKRKNN